MEVNSYYGEYMEFLEIVWLFSAVFLVVNIVFFEAFSRPSLDHFNISLSYCKVKLV